MSLHVVFDHAQRRMKRDRISALAGGVELNGNFFEDTYIDPITKTLFLRPGPLDPRWFTINTDPCHKYAVADLIFEHADKWTNDYKLGVDAGPWISSTEPAPGWLKTPSRFHGEVTSVYCRVRQETARIWTPGRGL